MRLTVPLLFAVPAVLIAAGTPSSIALSSSPNVSVFGRPVTLIAVVAPPTANGSVTFYDGTAVLGTTRLLGGQAMLITTLLSSGSRSLKAFYGGDSNYAQSTSATLAQKVNAVPGGQFQAAVSYGAGVNPISVAVGDFNGDGRADLVTANYGGNKDVSVLLGNGDGTFQRAVNYGTGGLPLSVAVGDFNGDGKPDLAIANYSISVLLGNGDGTFKRAVTYGTSNASWSVAVGDFNGDGKLDLATANLVPGAIGGNGNVSVLLGNGDGTFRAPVNYGAGNAPYFIAVGDFNGDGKADLAVANSKDNNVGVLLGNGDGTFQAPMNYAAGTSPYSIAVGDFNGDGRADLAIANNGANDTNGAKGGNGNVSVLLGNGDGTFQAAVNYGAGLGPYSIAVGDFNGDGMVDLVTANNGGNVSVLLGNGDGTFQAAVNYGAGDSLYSIAVGDFNGDGRADLVTATLGQNNVNVLLGLASAPDLSIVVTHAGDFTQGQSGATYAITASNVGFAPTSGTVTVTDSLPRGLVATNISGTGWTCGLGTLSCTRGDPLAGFASYPVITVTVAVSFGAPGGATNTVSVSGGGETNSANDTAADFTTTFTPSQLAQAWSSLNLPTSVINTDAVFLMTDGAIMVHQGCTGNWSRLSPDSFGNYATGTWSQVAAMQPGYGPNAFSSAVLADGRLVVIGGEYIGGANGCTAAETNLGAIYDPGTNIWTPLSAPSGWTLIGDSPNTVLSDGQFLLGRIQSTQIAKLDPVTLTWTSLKGTGKADLNSEEGWTLLPDGTVLTVNVQNGTQSERYFPSTDSWVSAGTTVAPLATLLEMGPQVLRPNGTVFVAGSTGHTAVYNVATGTWAAGPDFPVSDARQLAVVDGPGSLLPSGNILVGASSFVGASAFTGKAFPPVLFFEFDGTHLNPVPAPPSASGDITAGTRLLLLPTGQVLFSDGNNLDIYTPVGNPDPTWAPTIATAPTVVQPRQTYTITGTQFNGLSQAVGYGDDFQAVTNYPLVRIVNTATGHVFYCRTQHHSTMGVATGAALVSTQFDVPPSVETGPSTLVVVANGIASNPWSLIVTTNSTPPPLPSITSLNPSSATAAGAAFKLIVNGTGFLFGAALQWNGSPLSTTFVSAMQLTASVAANLIAGIGSAGIVAVNPGGAASNTVTLPINAPLPSITKGGVGPLYSSSTTIQPGEWVSIYGTNLASSTVTWNGNFPTLLGGTSVTINGKAAYLLYVSPGQIDLQAPDDTANGTVAVVVTTASGSTTSTVTLGQFGPSFSLLDTKHVAGIILRSNGSGAYGGGTYDILGPTGSSLGYATVAAKAGDSVELFGVGFGPTSPAVPAGQAFSGAALTTNPVKLLINNVSVTPAFAGLSSAGLYQINLTVPAGLGTGDVSLLATVGGVQTPPTVVISLK
jgi:uncharacterized protein (TIGR03437 family)